MISAVILWPVQQLVSLYYSDTSCPSGHTSHRCSGLQTQSEALLEKKKAESGRIIAVYFSYNIIIQHVTSPVILMTSNYSFILMEVLVGKNLNCYRPEEISHTVGFYQVIGY